MNAYFSVFGSGPSSEKGHKLDKTVLSFYECFTGDEGQTYGLYELSKLQIYVQLQQRQVRVSTVLGSFTLKFNSAVDK